MCSSDLTATGSNQTNGANLENFVKIQVSLDNGASWTDGVQETAGITYASNPMPITAQIYVNGTPSSNIIVRFMTDALDSDPLQRDPHQRTFLGGSLIAHVVY